MAGEIKDECGIAGVYYFNNNNEEKNVMPLLYKMLLNLQNRGQLSAGVSTYSERRDNLIQTYKEVGSVNEVFQTNNNGQTLKLFNKYAGRIGIGHVRYSTFGLPNRSYAHPFERKHGRKCKWFSFCFNGNIANFSELKNKLLNKKEYHMIYNSDTEIIIHSISIELGNLYGKLYNTGKLPDLKEAFKNLSEIFDGAYSLAFIDAEGRLVAVRDPHGIRPLCYSIDEEKVVFASESIALKNLGCKNIVSLNPGEILIAQNNQVKIERYTEVQKTAHCMFEYIYFANIASKIENKSIYEARINLGIELAKLETLPINPNDYVVVSVPDSSKPFGEGYAYYFGLPNREGLIRNRFVGRTFIDGNGRTEKIKNKFSLIKEVVKGKKVLLLDDSIIRGNTSKNLVSYIRNEGGAKEVHMRISCPAVVSPCFYGIDMSTVTELIAAKHVKNVGEDIDKRSSDNLAKEFKADSLIYQKIANIPKAIGIPRENLCMACIDGKYPTPYGYILCKKAVENHKNGVCSRTYEINSEKINKKNKVLIIGSGGREHALAWKLHEDKSVDEIYCIPGNAGTSSIAQNINIDSMDNDEIVKFVKKENIDLTIVGPEAPLVNGIVDEFEKNNLRIFGPKKYAAMLEGSKIFAKKIMQKYSIPTAKSKTFENADKAISFIKQNNWCRIIKADGLAAGKGVYVCDSEKEAINAVNEIMTDQKYGRAGDKILIEEKLVGEEASFIVFTDGKTVKPLLSSQDHKPIYDNDKGPNTGGMGAYAPAPIITKELHNQILETIMIPVIQAMEKEGCKYKGILYGGLMITKEGVKVIEFNCRFGDPEAQPLLALLKSDLLDIIKACIDGTLDKTKVEFKEGSACCVVMASKGYPVKYEKGKLISGIEEMNNNNFLIFHSGTIKNGNGTYTNGGRVLGITGIGDDIEHAINNAYSGVKKINFENQFYRTDIGQKALKKIEN